MLDQLSLPSKIRKSEAEDYFKKSPHREKALSDLVRKEAKWRTLREHQNEYRDSSVKLFDSEDVPISLDLHGFSANSSKTALVDFKDFAISHKLNKFHIIHGKGDVIGPLVNSYADSEFASSFYNYKYSGHVVFEAKHENSIWSPLVCNQSTISKSMSLPPHTLASTRETYNTSAASCGKVAKQARPDQPPKASSGGGIFSSIGGFLKGAAEGIGDWLNKAAESARSERERIAWQQQRYYTLYEEQRNLISKVYPRFKKVYCWSNYYMFIILSPIYIIQSIFQSIYEFEFMRIAISKIGSHWQYIVGLYGLTLILGLMFESHEKKKFYSIVPKEKHQEVEFNIFDSGLIDHIF